jgi:small-conductance mechanosensitive channel
MIDGIRDLRDLIVPSAFLVGGFLIALVIEKFLRPVLNRIAAKTAWEGNALIIGAFHGMAYWWFGTAGVYAALDGLPIPVRYQTLIDRGALIIYVLSVTVVLSRMLSGLVALYGRRVGGILMSTSIFTHLTQVLVYIIGVLVLLQSLGISITPILTALGVGGLAVALALQDTLSNLFAGIHTIASHKIRPGDYLRLENGQEGYVTDITWRYTTIRMLANNMIIIPNAKLASAVATNFSLPETDMSVPVEVGVSYESDLDKVEAVTIDVARSVMKEIEGGIPEFEPFIRYNKFDDSSINFAVILRGKEFSNQYLIRHEFIKRLQKRYRQEGIEIPFPIRTIRIAEQQSHNHSPNHEIGVVAEAPGNDRQDGNSRDQGRNSVNPAIPESDRSR